MSEHCPYKGLVPYGEEDARYFFGRDRERRLISAALRASRLTVLYGESGAGKSSVLAAGVAHDLRDDPDYALVLFRDWRDDPMFDLLDAVCGRLLNLPGFPMRDGSLDVPKLRSKGHFFWGPDAPQRPGELLQRWSEATKRALLIVLDQFEEYFQYHPGESGPGTLAEELPRLLSQADLPVNFLFAVREDALGTLDRFKGAIPNLFDNLLRVEHLTRKAAQEAIVEPLKKFKEDFLAGRFSASEDHHLHPIEIEEQVAAQVVSEILRAQGGEQERVQAPYLQLVMTRWWEREMESDSPAMRLNVLYDLGGVKTIVERYLEDTLAILSPQDKEIVAEVFRYMVTPTGRKIAQTTTDLTKNLHSFFSLRSLDGILSGLQGARLLRKVPPPRGSLPDETCYEFAHDVVAKAAFEWRRQFRRTQQLAEAERKEKEANHRAEEQARLAEMERQLSLKANLLAEAERQRAEEQRQRAEEQARLADAQGQLAAQAKRVAEETQKRAEEERRRGQEQARQAKRFRRLSLALGAMLLVAVAAVVFAFWQRAVAHARELVAASRATEDTDSELSVLLGAQALATAARPWGHSVLPEAEQQLHRAILASHVRLTLRGHSDSFTSVAWSLDGTRLATGSRGGDAKVWYAGSGQELMTLRGHKQSIESVAWSPDGKRLATGSEDKTTKLWDAASGRELLTLRGHSDEVTSVAWSPDGKRLATGSKDYTAKVWDAETGKELLTLSGQRSSVFSVAWSPDGKRLATGSSDGTAKTWDGATGKELLTVGDPKTLIWTVAWSPDGKRLATGGVVRDDDGVGLGERPAIADAERPQ